MLSWYMNTCFQKRGFYEMCNASIAPQIYENILEAYPDAKMLEIGGFQYFVVNENGVENLKIKIESERLEYEQKIDRLDIALKELNK